MSSLLLLPEEVLEAIVKLITVEDLIACSAVCLEWRVKFNNNVFWKRFCCKDIKGFLENSVCKAKPPFQPLQSTEERLEPVCYWRICYMREVHLINNWKSGNYTTLPVKKTQDEKIRAELKVDSNRNHWLLIWILVDSTESIEVWNVNNAPELVTTLPLISRDRSDYTTAMVIGEKLVVCQLNILTVYSLNNPVDTLFRCLLEENEPLESKFWNSTKCTDFQSLLTESVVFHLNPDCYHIFGDSFFLYSEADRFHIWDLDAQVKLRSESTLKDSKANIKIRNICKLNETQAVMESSGYSSILYIYDLKILAFKDVKFECSGKIDWCGCSNNQLVVLCPEYGVIEFFDISSGKRLTIRTTEIKEVNLGYYHIQLVDSYLVLYTCESNCISVMDIRNHEIVSVMELACPYVSYLEVVHHRYVLSWIYVNFNYEPYCKVWDMKKLSWESFKTHMEGEGQFMEDSLSLLKQVVHCNGFIQVRSFW